MRAAGCVTLFWLVGGEATEQCSRNLVLSLKLLSSTWVGAPVLQKNSKILLYLRISWVGTRTLPQGCTNNRLFPLFLYPLTSLISNCLYLPFGTQGRSWGWMKPISYRQEMENTEQICTLEPHGVLLSFNSGNWATMTVITSCQNGAQDCLSWENRHWTGSIPEFQVLELSLIWLNSQTLVSHFGVTDPIRSSWRGDNWNFNRWNKFHLFLEE